MCFSPDASPLPRERSWRQEWVLHFMQEPLSRTYGLPPQPPATAITTAMCDELLQLAIVPFARSIQKKAELGWSRDDAIAYSLIYGQSKVGYFARGLAAALCTHSAAVCCALLATAFARG